MVAKQCMRRALAFVGGSLALIVGIGAGVQASPATDAYKQGKLLLKEEKYDKAIYYFGKVIKQNPQNGNAYFERAQAYGYLGQWEKVIEDSNKAIGLCRTNNPAYLEPRAAAHYALGHYTDAISDLSRMIVADPKYPGVHRLRGTSYLKLGEYQKAIDDFSKAISLDSKDAEAYNNRGWSYEQLGAHQNAMDDFGKATSLEPDLARIQGTATGQKFRFLTVTAPISIPNARIEQSLRELKAYEVGIFCKGQGHRSYIVILPEQDLNYALKNARSDKSFSSVRIDPTDPQGARYDLIHWFGDNSIRFTGQHANELVLIARKGKAKLQVEKAIERLNCRLKQQYTSTATGPAAAMYIVACTKGSLLNTFLQANNDGNLQAFGPSYLTPYDRFTAGPEPKPGDW